MNTSSFLLNQDLAGLLVTLAGQSIIVSLVGIAVIRLLSGRSAPVRSLACAATISALGLLLVISIGFRLSGISWHQTQLPVFSEKSSSGPILSSELDKELPLPFESISPALQVQSQPSIEKGMVHSPPFQSSFSVQLSPQLSLFINVVGFIWLLGILFQLVKLGYGVALVKKFRNNLPDVQDTPFNDMVRTVAGKFWKERLPALYSSPRIESPITIGLYNPIVVIPEKLFATLSKNELKSILLHELSHIYHYDQVIGVIKRFVIAFHWWNPFVYSINWAHEQSREEVSDNYVLSELHPRVYTQCLVDLAKKVCLIGSFPAAAGMAGRRFNLRVRVEQLLSKERRIAMSTRLYLKAIAFSICIVTTFMIAGLHARVKALALNDSVKTLQENRSVQNPASIFEEKQHLSVKNLIEPEEIEAQAPDSLQVVSNVETMLQVESSNKQARESASPIRALVSAKTKAKEKSEKHVDSDTDQSVGGTILQEEAEDSIVLGQKNSAVEETPDANAYISRGASKLKKGQIEDATSDFNKAIDLDPQKPEAYVARGGVYFMLDQFDNAISDYNKAIEINPDLAVAYQNRGSVYYCQGQFDNAISDYSKAIEIDHEFTAAYQNRGYAYFIAGNYEKAISDYNKAIALNPENAEAYIYRGHSYYARRLFNKAISDYNKAISLNPKNANAYTYRGHVYFSNRIFDKAISDYDKAIALNPEASVAKKFLALAKNSRARSRWRDEEFNYNFWRMTYQR